MMDKIINTRGEWVLYDNGDVSYQPEDRDYWIDAARLKTIPDVKNWMVHLNRKTWFKNTMNEYDFESIVEDSFILRDLDIEQLQRASLNNYEIITQF